MKFIFFGDIKASINFELIKDERIFSKLHFREREREREREKRKTNK